MYLACHTDTAVPCFTDWNANSGDTSGIVQNDWSTIIFAEEDFLRRAIGLVLWYKSAAAVGLSNQGSTSIAAPYTLSLAFGSPLSVQQVWSWQAASANSCVVGTLSQAPPPDL
ncbi:hypothetical protein WJX81_005772 [Elliptochloris bilobata]|uniref:Uncharacterized protein n=1 Tax=Elliptochloris bilobata TaxID=381761 RepID=A0AAW1QM75_9CHLO